LAAIDKDFWPGRRRTGELSPRGKEWERRPAGREGEEKLGGKAEPRMLFCFIDAEFAPGFFVVRADISLTPADGRWYKFYFPKINGPYLKYMEV
jgi:hypothetical protein